MGDITKSSGIYLHTEVLYCEGNTIIGLFTKKTMIVVHLSFILELQRGKYINIKLYEQGFRQKWFAVKVSGVAMWNAHLKHV